MSRPIFQAFKVKTDIANAHSNKYYNALIMKEVAFEIIARIINKPHEQVPSF